VRLQIQINSSEVEKSMNVRHFLSVVALVGIASLVPGLACAGGFSGMDKDGVWDEPAHFFPGIYFEHKAQFYLKNKDYRAALEMFELAGYWADKIAQYNAGLMYFNGIGVPADKPRGVAWLHIAAEAQDDLAGRALQLAYADLTAAQRAEADAIWHQLDEKYGDRVTLPRALNQYNADLTAVTGSHLGYVIGNLSVQEVGGGDGLPEIGAVYLRRQDKTMNELISKITGHVRVGAVQPLKVADAARANASTIPLDVPQQPAPDSH
jgi:TPR repeat protein